MKECSVYVVFSNSSGGDERRFGADMIVMRFDCWKFLYCVGGKGVICKSKRRRWRFVSRHLLPC